MSASPAIRSLRAAVFAAVCVLLAVAGHGLAAGGTPPLWADGAGFLVVFAAGWLLGGRERTLPGITAAMLAVQAGLHTVFSRTIITAEPVMRMTRTHMGQMHMGSMHMSPTQMGHMRMAQMHGLTAPHPHAMTPHAVLAHVLAALVASWWLRRGEAALWSLLRRAVALLPGLAAWWGGPSAPFLRPAADCVPADAVPPLALLLRHAVSRRGPPTRIPYTV
ncbi:hypothetical protein FNH09_23070 [Streptomyces adustus]|uniref:Uncharacterized protein n=1 Tax=Streptomyces adustus TaxID=1609272 RepID=A0A5N8VFM3_9ACTN|nr:hypothetical protein [Streptomyces adustus]MPY34021.1 hypothetical protein [Streptomyces adustus]